MEQTGLVEFNLLQGCHVEAARAEVVAYQLVGLKAAIKPSLHPYLTATIEEIRTSTRSLRDLADQSQVYFDRIPVVLGYLEILLPCMCRSLRDITTHYEDRSLSVENRWRKMYHQMTDEANGLGLPQRFMLYNHFILLLRQLLTRAPSFDLNSMETARLQLMKLREAREIPPPPIRVTAAMRTEALLSATVTSSSIHWAEQIFSLPLPSRTALKSARGSRSYGPHLPFNEVNMPDDTKVLFMRPFNEGSISLVMFLAGPDRSPYLLLRTFHMGIPWFSLRGVHELRIEREGSCLHLKRFSASENCVKLWATLNFMTWEEMTLLYCTFLSLKASSPGTVRMSAPECIIHGEKKLFQARIMDDGFKHSLIVYKDRLTRGIRLHAAVWDSELCQYPVWTAFITHQCASPTWLKRVCRRRVRLVDVQLYVFCQNYQQQNQRRGSVGAFELNFCNEEASQRFMDLMLPVGSDPTVTTESTE